MRETGIITRCFEDRGFAFARRAGAPDIFVHIKQFRNGTEIADITPGLQIEFDVESTPRGLRAVDVVVV